MDFACRACGSPAVAFPDRLDDDAQVKCQRCEVTLCTLREFRLYAEDAAAQIEPTTNTRIQSELGADSAVGPRRARKGRR
jgi:hypothetical protein